MNKKFHRNLEAYGKAMNELWNAISIFIRFFICAFPIWIIGLIPFLYSLTTPNDTFVVITGIFGIIVFIFGCITGARFVEIYMEITRYDDI